MRKKGENSLAIFPLLLLNRKKLKKPLKNYLKYDIFILLEIKVMFFDLKNEYFLIKSGGGTGPMKPGNLFLQGAKS
jgi:hypothetical protein